MKKAIVLTLLMLSFAGSAFAAALATNVATTAGLSVFGGVDATAAGAASSPLVKFSTGVQGLCNFVTATHVSYAIVTKHNTGNKYFGTANDSTSIYWFQSITGVLLPATAGSVAGNSNFATAGWTAY